MTTRATVTMRWLVTTSSEPSSGARGARRRGNDEEQGWGRDPDPLGEPAGPDREEHGQSDQEHDLSVRYEIVHGRPPRAGGRVTDQTSRHTGDDPTPASPLPREADAAGAERARGDVGGVQTVQGQRGVHGRPVEQPAGSARTVSVAPGGRSAPRSRCRGSVGPGGGSTTCPGCRGSPSWVRVSMRAVSPMVSGRGSTSSHRNSPTSARENDAPTSIPTTRSRTSGSATGSSVKTTWNHRWAPSVVARSRVRTDCCVIWPEESRSRVTCTATPCMSRPMSVSPRARRASGTPTARGAEPPSSTWGGGGPGSPGRPDPAAQGIRVEAEQLLDLGDRVEGGRLLGLSLPRAPVAQRPHADPVPPVGQPTLQGDQREPAHLHGPSEDGREAVPVGRPGHGPVRRHGVEGGSVRADLQPKRENPGVHRTRARYVNAAALRFHQTGALWGSPGRPMGWVGRARLMRWATCCGCC